MHQHASAAGLIVLRAPADARGGVRPAGAHHVHLACATSPRTMSMSASKASLSLRFGDYLNAIPLPTMHRRVQGGGVEQLRPAGRADSAHDLLHRRCAARRPPRHRRHAQRGDAPIPPSMRTLLERLIHRRAYRPDGESFEPVCPVTFKLRPAGGESALRHHLPPLQRRRARSPPHRHGGSRRQVSSCCMPACDAGAGARPAAATVHGREIRPRFASGKTHLAEELWETEIAL